MSRTTQRVAELPRWANSLVVVAHPDDESFGLGAVIDGLGKRGCAVTVLCFTRGEASTLHGVTGDLADIRADELRRAGYALGVGTTLLRTHPDGALGSLPVETLAADVADVAARVVADGLIAFDESGVTGHPDHQAATRAALAAAVSLDLPLLTWTLPELVADQLNSETGAAFSGRPPADVDLVVAVTRDRQRIAVREHASQALPTSVLWRRLELLGDREHLRWARRAQVKRPASA